MLFSFPYFEYAEDISSQVASADEMITPEDVVDEDLVSIYGDELLDSTYAIEVRSSSSMFRIIDCQLTVEDGVMTAAVTLSSAKYDYMLVGEEKYLPVNTEGNASFEIVLTGLDYRMPVTIDSTALGKPQELDYVLYFDSASIVKE